MVKWENKGHELDHIGKLLQGKKHVYLYGIGGVAQEIINVLNGLEQWVDWQVHFVDCDEEKQCKGYKGRKVISPTEFFSENKSDYFVIICPNGKTGDEIYKNVRSSGINDGLIFMGEYFLYNYLTIYFLYEHDMVFFTSQNILPSNVCNLNCRDCLNFTPYIKKPIIYSLENIKKDVDLFFNAVDLIYRFQITGGEPLLYPHLREVIEYIHDNYKEKILRLEIVTNGTVMPTDEQCKLFNEKKVHVFLDDYRNALKDKLKKIREEIRQKFIDFKVDFEDNYVDKWFRLYVPERREFIAKEQDLIRLFNACGNPWSTIEQGKLSACNYSLYAMKAGVVGFNDSEDDYFDLTKFDSSKKSELIEFRLRYNKKGYVTLCSKCSGWSAVNKVWCSPAIQVD